MLAIIFFEMLAIIIFEMLSIKISKPPIIIIIIIAAADHNHNNNHHNPCGGQKGRTVSIYWINPNSIIYLYSIYLYIWFMMSAVEIIMIIMIGGFEILIASISKILIASISKIIIANISGNHNC
jgi:hypothetical protein